MKNRMMLIIATFSLTAVALAGCSPGPGSSAQELLPATSPEGVVYVDVSETAPSVPDGQLTLGDGETIQLSEVTDNRPAVLLFFDTWCNTCIDAQPSLNETAERYGDAVAFIAVASASDKEEVAAYARDHGLSYPAVLDADGALAQSFAVDEAPFTVLLGQDNRLVRGWPYYPKDLGDAIDELLVESMPEADASDDH